MLKVHKLSKFYFSKLAVSNVSFQLQDAEIVGLLGLNGAGKSSLLRMLSTYLEPSSGSIELDGNSYQKQKLAVQKLIGYAPDRPVLYPEMTVLEYLRYFGSLRGLSRKVLTEQTNFVLEQTELTTVRHKLCRHLSRGYAQRACLAQAILHRPKLLILDEPMNGLDPEQVIILRNLLRLLSKDSTILISSHSLTDVAQLCSRVLIIHQGVLQKDLNLTGANAAMLEQIFVDSISSKPNNKVLDLRAA